MSGGFNVEQSALHAYVKAVEAAAGRIEAIRSRTQRLELAQQAFGKLPQSDDLKADYDTQRQESGKDLQDAVETLHSTAEALRDSADSYEAVENENRDIVGGGR
ncbi:hypothetical protein GTU99_13615 [Streptomyces sp. PRKS01-65]|nr:hypothetical protein [Streptomyces harenosi]NEY33217.1 hypothetical protein [Streptomyces harenosi]